jgi:hypothetical protein
MPSVTQTAAVRGLRPVANALGAIVGDTYSRGIGWRACVDSSRTMRYSPGASASLTGRARMERRASLSLLKYAMPLTTSEIAKAITSPVEPPSQFPASRIRAESSPSRAAVLTPLYCRCIGGASLLARSCCQLVASSDLTQNPPPIVPGGPEGGPRGAGLQRAYSSGAAWVSTASTACGRKLRTTARPSAAPSATPWEAGMRYEGGGAAGSGSANSCAAQVR